METKEIYDGEEWMDYLPAYDLTEDTQRMLDQVRKIVKSNSYYYLGFGIPDERLLPVAALGTIESTITVQPYSYLTYITAAFDQAPGFQLNIYDKGVNAYMSEGFLLSETFARDMSPTNPGEPFGPRFLEAPLAVSKQGQLNVEITNLATSPNNIRLLFAMAVPLTPKSVGAPLLQGGE